MRVRGLSALLLCTACTLPAVLAPARTDTPAPPPTNGTAATAAITAVAGAVLAEVNRTRESRGLTALTGDAALNRAAREHAEELAARRTLDHSSIDPRRHTMTMRIEAAGATWTRAAENLASVSGDASRVPAAVVRLWLESDGHRVNMLGDAYTHTGVGVAVDRVGVWYVTQLYTVPRKRR